MRILQLHSDFIEYRPIQKEIALAEEAEAEERRLEEIVVLFTAVEKGDGDAIARKAIDEVEAFLKKLKVKRILIYPYAHLSSNLAEPATAMKLLGTMETQARKKDLEVHRAPFGWNKQFKISVKGHPLAEQSRSIFSDRKRRKKEQISEALKAERKMKSSWFILKQDGKMTAVEKFDFLRSEDLGKFARYEMAKARASEQVPPHVTLMKRLEIADYEPGSDSGNLRWYPKGRLIKSLLELFVSDRMNEYGAMEVETPVMYDFAHPSLSKYLDRFPARQYVVKSDDKELFLRFASCFGQFLMIKDTQFSYRQMPLKIYELTRYSFRREQSGEVVGLRRLRAFTMPDCHALCTDLAQAKEEFTRRFKLCIRMLEELGLSKDDYEVAIRFTRSFYRKNKRFISSLVKAAKKHVLIEMWEKRFFYFILKWDFNVVDNQDKAAALSTDQLDVENAERYGINYADDKGEKRYPLILHCSPIGAIERCVYALLEKAYKDQKAGATPMLPLWLSPTQVRLIPISDERIDYVSKLAETLEHRCIRVDIDDRTFTMQRKVREAETEWIPYIIVVGKRELESNELPVRDRRAGKIRGMKLEQLAKEIENAVKCMPFKSLSGPRELSKRPQFYG